MNRLEQRKKRRERRKERVRHAIRSKRELPRLVFSRTNRFLFAQVINDSKGLTVCFAASNEKDFSVKGKNKISAEALGVLIAERALEKGVRSVVLDRRGMLYHGRVLAFSAAARGKGLEF